jgi:hypothetical protein
MSPCSITTRLRRLGSLSKLCLSGAVERTLRRVFIPFWWPAAPWGYLHRNPAQSRATLLGAPFATLMPRLEHPRVVAERLRLPHDNSPEIAVIGIEQAVVFGGGKDSLALTDC